MNFDDLQSKSKNRVRKQEERRKKKQHAMRKTTLLVSLVVLLTMCVYGSIAFLYTNTNSVENTFLPANVTPTINESFDDYVKQNVTVTNTGNARAYVRAAIVATWQNDSGEIAPVMPVLGTDFSMEIGTQWTFTDGFYYYKGILEPNGAADAADTSDELIVSAQQLMDGPSEGYTLHIEILAQTIQADFDGTGDHPVKLSWGIDPSTLG